MERNLRIITGLILYLFIAMHLLNVSLGVISPELIESTRGAFMYIWSNRAGGMLLMASVLVHMVLSLRALYLRNTLNMTPSDTVQFASGFLIPPLLIPHVWGVIAMVEILDIEPTYPFLMQLFWIDTPLEGLRQVILIVIIWIHGSIGIFTWLRLKTWWSTVAPLIYPLIVLIPILGMLGFVEGGNLAINQYEAALSAQEDVYQTDTAPAVELTEEEIAEQNRRAEQFASDYAFVIAVKWNAILLYLAMLVGTLIARYIRLASKSGMVTVRYDDGSVVEAGIGNTFLELSHLNSIPHANLCRGRGRCGTCRVRILSSTADLPQPSELEVTALELTGSDENVRLACQCVPGAGNVEIERLFQADISHSELRASRQRQRAAKTESQPTNEELIPEAGQ